MSTLSFRKILSVPQLGTVKLGNSFDTLVAQGKVLSTQDGSGYRSTQLDLNGDGLADAFLTESLDATGKVTHRGLSVNANGVSFSAQDNNADGKIDGFYRSDAKGAGYQVTDGNGDGKADGQWTWTAKGTSHYVGDGNYDGKIDYRQDSRSATSKDQFVALPTVPGLDNAKLGVQLSSLVPAGAKEIGWNAGPTQNITSWDVNGDYVADVTQIQNLDANRQVVSTSVTLNQPAQADGTPGASVTLNDTDNDGVADSEWMSQGKTWYSVSDTNHDGKIDTEQVQQNGQSRCLTDQNGDGKVDSVTSWQTLS